KPPGVGDWIWVGSLIAGRTPLELLLDPFDRARQLLATALGRAAKLGGDLGPLAALGSEVSQQPLFLRQPAAKLGADFAAGHQPAGTGDRRRSSSEIRRCRALEPPIMATVRTVPAHLVGQLVASHDHQEPKQLVGLLQVVLTRGGPHKEAG